MTPVLTIGDIARFLAGSRRAILAIASTRWSLLIGALLVLTGSLARNYDGAYMPAEWHVLAHGAVVSTANALVLYALVYAAAKGRRAGAPFWGGYLAFLGLFWMTAPMAWLYGIPYERFLSPLDALHANMWTLALVSVWRVALISRALAVLFGERTRRVVWITLAFADGLLLAALWLAPLPVIDFMGGMQQSPEEQELAGTAFMAGFVGAVTGPIWLIGALVAAARMKGAWNVAPSPSRAPAPRATIIFAALVLAAWIGITIAVQPEQRRRFQAEKLLREGQVEAALTEMSSHPRSDYPPIWDPPPRPTWRIYSPPIDAVRAALVARRYAPWVEELFWDKCWRDLCRNGFVRWKPASDWAGYVQRGSSSPDWWRSAQLHADSDPHLSEEDRKGLREAIEAWRKLEEKKD